MFQNFVSYLFKKVIPGPVNVFNQVKDISQGRVPGIAGDLINPTAESKNAFNMFSNIAQSLTAKYAGNELTGAQREQNAFNAAEAQKQRDWETQMANSQYQRGVADMQAAGVNPALMYGGGASPAPTPSGAAASGSAPAAGNLSDLFQLMMLPSQIENLRANTEVAKSSAAKNTAQAQGEELNNEFLQRTMENRIKAQELANNLTEANTRQVYKAIDHAESDIKLKIQQAKTEEEKQVLLKTQEILAKANAQQIIEMLPYQKALAEAQTQAQKAQASLAFAQALYQKKLIDGGYLDALIDKAKSDARTAEDQAMLADIKRNIKTGNVFAPSDTGIKWIDKVNDVSGGFLNSLFQAVSIIGDALPGQGLFNLLK